MCSRRNDLLTSGLLIVDRIQHTVQTVIAGKNTLTEMDLVAYPNTLSKVEKVQLVDRFNAKQTTTGSLYITTTHIIFAADDGKETWILHSHISSVERGQITAIGCPLTINCKSFLCVSFLMSRDKECQDVYETLNEISQPLKIEEVYALSYVPSNKEFLQSDGWDTVGLVDDFARLGLPNETWVSVNYNANYAHCDTYPQTLFLPRTVPKQVFIGSSKFRSRGRLPVLAYMYPATKACICRCSQPLTGFSARCVEDEALMEHILRTNNKSNVLYVVDTRPKMNAMANKAAGKGFENESYYSNMKFYFFGIENIHVMRTSMQKMLETISQRNSSVTSFLSGLESSAWLRHVRAVLEAGTFVAESVLKGINCVVHCSDGWDRTAQTISVACLILDPYYRTIKGFQTLIEKDWLAFGHKFNDRCGHTRQSDSKEISPVFTQFIECVWNMMQQFPRAFEFNEHFLLILHDNVYACQFGTFLGNCEKDRVDLRLSQRTYSFWGYINRQLEDIINPIYDPSAENVLKMDLRPQLIRFWSAMYNRFDAGIHPRESLYDLAENISQHLRALEYTADDLKQQISNLKMALGRTLKSPTSPCAMQDSGNFTTETVEGLAMSFQASLDSELNNFEANSQIGNLKISSDAESGVEDLLTPTSSSKDRSGNARLSNQTGRGSLDTKFSVSEAKPGIESRWKIIRQSNDCCACGGQFQTWQKKYHCWHCGDVFCRRCVDCTMASSCEETKKRVICRLCKDSRLTTPNVA